MCLPSQSPSSMKNEVEARSIPARVVAGAASCVMGEVSARVGDACTAAATLGRRHRRHIKVPLFWRTAWRWDWGREHRLGRAFHWRRDPRAADPHTGAAQIAERPCHVALSGFGKAKVIRESTKRCVITGARTFKPLTWTLAAGLGRMPTRCPRLLLLDRRRRPEGEGAHARAAGCGSRATPRRARAWGRARVARQRERRQGAGAA